TLPRRRASVPDAANVSSEVTADRPPNRVRQARPRDTLWTLNQMPETDKAGLRAQRGLRYDVCLKWPARRPQARVEAQQEATRPEPARCARENAVRCRSTRVSRRAWG